MPAASTFRIAMLFALASPAIADLPVHCLRSQVQGEWEFLIGPSSDRRSSCGHKHPDNEDGQPAREDVVPSGSLQRFLLQDPNVVVDASGQRGKWTMIYDEGFQVSVADRVFFAFSNFTFQKDNITHEKKNFTHCGDTMVGWYRNENRTVFGCYYGYKVSGKVAPQPAPTTNQAAPSEHHDKVLDEATLGNKVARLNKKLNMLQLGWKARVMKKWVGRSIREINSYAGIRRTASTSELHKDMLRQQVPGRRKQRSFLQHAKPKLPKSWDWSEPDSEGKVFIEPVMDQSECGSCYAASTMRMLSARYKIKEKDPSLLPFSINMPLFCGEYNQGCKGGYPFLMTKWSSEVGLLPATCMRYNVSGGCKLECDLSKLPGKRYRADNYHYLGSFYGNASVDEMMEELYLNGPITVAFEPAEDFMYYSDGIYESVNVTSNNRTERPEWEKVDHAVLLVGYGEENGTKYWKLQNSWGPDWGEDGFFRMRRGVDESAVESIVVAADVIEDEQQGRRVREFFENMEL